MIVTVRNYLIFVLLNSNLFGTEVGIVCVGNAWILLICNEKFRLELGMNFAHRGKASSDINFHGKP
jgi:hypothetical protein